MKEARHKKVHIVLIPLHKILEHKKNMSQTVAKCQLKLAWPVCLLEVGLLLTLLSFSIDIGPLHGEAHNMQLASHRMDK